MASGNVMAMFPDIGKLRSERIREKLQTGYSPGQVAIWLVCSTINRALKDATADTLRSFVTTLQDNLILTIEEKIQLNVPITNNDNVTALDMLCAFLQKKRDTDILEFIRLLQQEPSLARLGEFVQSVYIRCQDEALVKHPHPEESADTPEWKMDTIIKVPEHEDRLINEMSTNETHFKERLLKSDPKVTCVKKGSILMQLTFIDLWGLQDLQYDITSGLFKLRFISWLQELGLEMMREHISVQIIDIAEVRGFHKGETEQGFGAKETAKKMTEKDKESAIAAEMLRQERENTRLAEKKERKALENFQRQGEKNMRLMGERMAEEKREREKMRMEFEQAMKDKEKERIRLESEGMTQQAAMYQKVIDEMKTDRDAREKASDQQMKALQESSDKMFKLMESLVQKDSEIDKLKTEVSTMKNDQGNNQELQQESQKKEAEYRRMDLEQTEKYNQMIKDMADENRKQQETNTTKQEERYKKMMSDMETKYEKDIKDVKDKQKQELYLLRLKQKEEEMKRLKEQAEREEMQRKYEMEEMKRRYDMAEEEKMRRDEMAKIEKMRRQMMEEEVRRLEMLKEEEMRRQEMEEEMRRQVMGDMRRLEMLKEEEMRRREMEEEMRRLHEREREIGRQQEQENMCLIQ